MNIKLSQLKMTILQEIERNNLSNQLLQKNLDAISDVEISIKRFISCSAQKPDEIYVSSEEVSYSIHEFLDKKK